ncbi:MAG: hypothetical protein HYU27_09440 [Acidobacteria bacterium]|nr:hypothetical protein [Acidobacteriota bacterium]
MRFRRSAILLLSVVAVTVSWAQLPMDPVRDSGASVTGAYEGWYQNPDGTYTLLAGYFNRNAKQTLDIPAGPNNHIDPGGPDQGQPTHFLNRRQWGVFAIIVPKDFGNKRLTWTITANGQTTSIPMTLNPLWIVEPFKDAGVGNTPPVIQFDPAGAAYQGPPRGIAASFTTKSADTLSLTAWVTDDGKQPPEARPRQGPPANISWSKFRGPGDVTFENPRPSVDAKDGKTATTVKFSAPGEYVLRAQANDATGEGGGGFQCCWTNAHVKVTVTP